jgi:ABC-type branched-subunit amino acid transport system ATPase component
MALVLQAVSRAFGGVAAVVDMSFDVPAGSTTALIGANGAGKSTLLNLISGALRVDSGSVEIFGRDVTGTSAQRRSRQGVGRTFQTPRLVPRLNCLENVMTGAEAGLGLASALLPLRPREREIADRAAASMRTVGVPEERWLRRPAQVSAQDRLLTQVARVIVAEPRLVLLDEPSVGFNANETAHLRGVIQGMAERGCAVLLVTHDVPFAMTTASKIVAMNRGRLIGWDTPVATANHPEVIESYLGRKGRDAALKVLHDA